MFRKSYISKIPAQFSLLVFTCLFSIAVSAQELASSDGLPTDEAALAVGAKLYNGNCTQCHAINEVVIGPALKNVQERRPVEWLILWIRNSQKLIESGDEYAVSIYNQYQKTAMPAYPFSDDEIKGILAYIKAESNKVVEVAVTSDTTGGTVTSSNDSVSSGYLTAILIVLVFVLLLILVVLGLIVSVLTRYINGQKNLSEEDTEIVNQKVDLFSFIKADAFVGVVIFIFTAIVLKTAIDGLFTIGVQQGYQPTQPIAFSHQLHAGQYEIECQYCHTGVTKSKSANIPSPNICMNCHSGIKNVAGKEGVSSEIAKIYAAIDFNPETGEYGNNTKPIEWVRIHNLPDLSYFNHAQHVKVGGLECQTCHGPVQEMEVVYQYSNLTMGWCINCHRETEVNSKNNAYYDNLVKLHEAKSKEPMKVEDIGGLECAKCHY